MNDMSFSNIRIQSISSKGKYHVITGITKIPTEKGALFNASVQVFIESSIFAEINEKKDQLLKVGNTFSATGKTVCDINGSNILFNILVTKKRRIDLAKKNFEILVKLLDADVDELVSISNPNTSRTEVICKYYNTENKQTGERSIIVSIKPEKSKILQEKSSYNCSGYLVIRQSSSNLLLVVVAKTFIKDVELNSDMLEFPDL